MKAMIFAAGLGTRLKPLTNDRPKALVEIGGLTLLERSIRYLASYGIKDITINVHHFAQQVIDFLATQKFPNLSLHISDERENLLDTGGGILKAKSFLEGSEPIVFMNVDILTNLDLQQLVEFHESHEALASLVVRQRATSRYLLFDAQHQLTGWINKKTGEQKMSRPQQIHISQPLAFSGIHMVSPKLLSLMTETGKFSIIDLYLRLAKSEKILGFTDSQSIWMDLGKYEDLEEAILLTQQLAPKA